MGRKRPKKRTEVKKRTFSVFFPFCSPLFWGAPAGVFEMNHLFFGFFRKKVVFLLFFIFCLYILEKNSIYKWFPSVAGKKAVFLGFLKNPEICLFLASTAPYFGGLQRVWCKVFGHFQSLPSTGHCFGALQRVLFGTFLRVPAGARQNRGLQSLF